MLLWKCKNVTRVTASYCIGNIIWVDTNLISIDGLNNQGELKIENGFRPRNGEDDIWLSESASSCSDGVIKIYTNTMTSSKLSLALTNPFHHHSSFQTLTGCLFFNLRECNLLLSIQPNHRFGVHNLYWLLIVYCNKKWQWLLFHVWVPFTRLYLLSTMWHVRTCMSIWNSWSLILQNSLFVQPKKKWPQRQC